MLSSKTTLSPLVPTVAALLLWWQGPAAAATTVQFVLMQAGQPAETRQSAFIDAGKMLITGAGGDPGIDLLFQSADQTLTIINHHEKTTLDVDADRVATLAGQAESVVNLVQDQVQQQMEKLSEADRERVKAMMESLGVGGLIEAPAESLPRTYKTVGDRQINAFRCEMTEIYQGGRMVSQSCNADPADLGIPAEDIAVVEALEAMSDRLREETAHISRQIGQNIPQFGDATLPGVPVHMEDMAGNAMTVSSIDPGIGAANMDKPKGYTPRQMPGLPDIMQ